MNIMTVRLFSWADSNGIKTGSQAGFSKCSSKIGNIFSLQASVQKHAGKEVGFIAFP